MAAKQAAPDLFDPHPPVKCGLVLNPASLRNSRNPILTNRLVSRFEGMGESVLVGEGDRVTAALRRWRSEGVDLIAISGGDGTIHFVVDEVIHLWEGDPLPRFFFLHGGTTGFMARETGNLDPLRASFRLHRARKHGTPLPAQYVDTLCVGDRYTLSFGIGVFRNLSQEYTTYGGIASLSHFLLGVRFAASWFTRGELAARTMRPCAQTIIIDGETFPRRHFVGLFAAGLSRLWIFRAYEEIDCPDDAFRMVGIRALRPWTFLRGIRPVVRGEGEELPREFLLRGVKRLEIVPGAGDPVHYMADGEYYTESDPLVITKGPRLTILRPGLL